MNETSKISQIEGLNVILDEIIIQGKSYLIKDFIHLTDFLWYINCDNKSYTGCYYLVLLIKTYYFNIYYYRKRNEFKIYLYTLILIFARFLNSFKTYNEDEKSLSKLIIDSVFKIIQFEIDQSFDEDDIEVLENFFKDYRQLYPLIDYSEDNFENDLYKQLNETILKLIFELYKKIAENFKDKDCRKQTKLFFKLVKGFYFDSRDILNHNKIYSDLNIITLSYICDFKVRDTFHSFSETFNDFGFGQHVQKLYTPNTGYDFILLINILKSVIAPSYKFFPRIFSKNMSVYNNDFHRFIDYLSQLLNNEDELKQYLTIVNLIYDHSNSSIGDIAELKALISEYINFLEIEVSIFKKYTSSYLDEGKLSKCIDTITTVFNDYFKIEFLFEKEPMNKNYQNNLGMKEYHLKYLISYSQLHWEDDFHLLGLSFAYNLAFKIFEEINNKSITVIEKAKCKFIDDFTLKSVLEVLNKGKNKVDLIFSTREHILYLKENFINSQKTGIGDPYKHYKLNLEGQFIRFLGEWNAIPIFNFDLSNIFYSQYFVGMTGENLTGTSIELKVIPTFPYQMDTIIKPDMTYYIYKKNVGQLIISDIKATYSQDFDVSKYKLDIDYSKFIELTLSIKYKIENTQPEIGYAIPLDEKIY